MRWRCGCSNTARVKHSRPQSPTRTSAARTSGSPIRWCGTRPQRPGPHSRVGRQGRAGASRPGIASTAFAVAELASVLRRNYPARSREPVFEAGTGPISRGGLWQPRREGSPKLSADEALLAGARLQQELERSWGGFTNFAISFSIISVLAGCFTNFFAAWTTVGPVMASIGLAVVGALILVIGALHGGDLLVDARPRAGSTTGRQSRRPSWGWFTGWLNLVGLVGVVASVDYALALVPSSRSGCSTRVTTHSV